MVTIEEVLHKLGLDDNETKTYLALLELGEDTISKIAERTRLGRVNTYQITEKLINKGLVSYIIKNNVKYFSSANPNILLRNLQSLEDELKSIMNELESRQNSNFETKVEVYRGREGVNTILRMILRDNKTYFFLGGIEESCRAFELESKIFIKKAERMKIKGMVIARNEDKFFVGKNEEYRFFPKNVILPTTSWIWGDKMGIFIWMILQHQNKLKIFVNFQLKCRKK